MISEDYGAAFPNEDLPALSEHYARINNWREVYRGFPKWQQVKRSGLYKSGKRPMNMLNTGKQLCDELACLCFAEQVEIACDVEEYKKYIERVIEENGFWNHVPEMLSRAFAEGGCVLREYVKNGRTAVNYISAADFLPLEWDNRYITSAVFRSDIYKNGWFYTVFEKQTASAEKTLIETFLFKSKSKDVTGQRCSLDEIFDGVKDVTVLPVPLLFQYFKTDTANNFEVDVPLGISVFANCTDTLKALDVVFDSFAREFILGKKRIIVPSSCIQTVVDTDTGALVKYFDADDEAYVALKCDEERDLKITDNTVALRVEEHIRAINALLDILCFQTGLSSGTLSFDGESLKTATEVISQESKTARTVRGHKNQLVEFIEDFCHAVIRLGVMLGELKETEYTLSVSFKDNVIIDENTLIDNNIKLVAAGLQSKTDALIEIFKCDEKTALEKLERIAKEQNMGGAELDDLFKGGSE